ncbi:uncharacterized protein KD926_002207 [Aspergillus affinis]|uniref:uncharacterized protein n=1 Tax=Aspergillus affinis TaxID=1070780 RepID=UPI0022FE5A09|nr:uncharacterized protein KD926_002207 [Aspergillus affinis]KAI9036177.1 hypothetical protein KD926_002207 [Aspergillus affinis]
MDDNSRVVARLPFTFAGPAKLATASEVATIQYLQRKTSIPIPKILDWSDDAGNSVGSKYIIMEHAAGVPLQQKWPYLSGEQKHTDLSIFPLPNWGLSLGYRSMANSALGLTVEPDIGMLVSEDTTSMHLLTEAHSSSIEPAFWYADEVPDFAAYAPSSTSSTQEVVGSELCAKTYDACTQFLMPKVAQPRLMDESMFRPFQVGENWNCWLVSIRVPTTQEIVLRQKEYRRFEVAQHLKRDLSGLLDCATDGWVPPENLETAKRENEAMFQGMLNAVLINEDTEEDEPVRDERDLRHLALRSAK